mmetsp:Transcript_7162/g.10640  ORF Transcript_7162/g.10640 Transcript_7162/m.10640 type:complete len:117 (-) Transcript_7162:4-354(-)
MHSSAAAKLLSQTLRSSIFFYPQPKFPSTSIVDLNASSSGSVMKLCFIQFRDSLFLLKVLRQSVFIDQIAPGISQMCASAQAQILHNSSAEAKFLSQTRSSSLLPPTRVCVHFNSV